MSRNQFSDMAPRKRSIRDIPIPGKSDAVVREEENEIMNERVYTEGIKHHLPETEMELPQKEEVKNIRP